MSDAPRQKIVSVGERELSTDPHVLGQWIPLVLECGHVQHGVPHVSFRAGDLLACYRCRDDEVAAERKSHEKHGPGTYAR